MFTDPSSSSSTSRFIPTQLQNVNTSHQNWPAITKWSQFLAHRRSPWTAQSSDSPKDTAKVVRDRSVLIHQYQVSEKRLGSDHSQYSREVFDFEPLLFFKNTSTNWASERWREHSRDSRSDRVDSSTVPLKGPTTSTPLDCTASS